MFTLILNIRFELNFTSILFEILFIILETVQMDFLNTDGFASNLANYGIST